MQVFDVDLSTLVCRLYGSHIKIRQHIINLLFNNSLFEKEMCSFVYLLYVFTVLLDRLYHGVVAATFIASCSCFL